MVKRKPKKLGVIDAETDPFRHGRIPEPFAWEFHSDERTEWFWGKDCTDQLLRYLDELPDEHMIFAHNGGKFDFHFMHAHIDNPTKIINSRIVQAQLGKHVLRDSLAIIPVPLARFFKNSKGDIDYRKMEAEHREKYRDEILEYLHLDCVSLLRTVTAFVERFGAKLTVGSTAMGELIKLHDFEKMRATQDSQFRPFYYGGRVQCFKSGIIKGPLIMLDVNSEYPTAMKKWKHPISATFHELDYLPDETDELTFFVDFTGRNDGALPTKLDDGGLSFNFEYGRFQACSHEIFKAMEYGLIRIDEVHQVWMASECGTFENFVDKFYAEKVAAKMLGDELTEMFSKFMLNSAYGKFGSNPENFRDWFINRDFGNDTALMANDYRLEVEYDEFELWSRPAANADNSFFNVATAASITSAARSIMLDGIQHCDDPIYCDTDSLLCHGEGDVDTQSVNWGFNGAVSKSELGAWKLEKTAPEAAVAGKKLYTLYDPETLKLAKTLPCAWNKRLRDENPERKPIKISSKGGSLSVDEIISVAKGAKVLYENDAPTFSFHRPTRFIHRNFRMTAESQLDGDLPLAEILERD